MGIHVVREVLVSDLSLAGEHVCRHKHRTRRLYPRQAVQNCPEGDARDVEREVDRVDEGDGSTE